MAREELDNKELEQVNGGSYINASMTIREIIETDRNLVGMLAQFGISATGNKSVQGMSLYEVASARGVDAYAIEDKINDYLSGK